MCRISYQSIEIHCSDMMTESASNFCNCIRLLQGIETRSVAKDVFMGLHCVPLPCLDLLHLLVHTGTRAVTPAQGVCCVCFRVCVCEWVLCGCCVGVCSDIFIFCQSHSISTLLTHLPIVSLLFTLILESHSFSFPFRALQYSNTALHI